MLVDLHTKGENVRFKKIDSSTAQAVGAAKTPASVILTHGDQSITWSVKMLEINRGKVRMTGVVDPNSEDDIPQVAEPYEHLNEYLALLNAQQLNELFGIYQTVYRELEDPMNDVPDLLKKLPELIAKIFKICTPQTVSNWVRTTGSIRFPSNIRVYPTLQESAERGDQFGLSRRPASATYIEEDYWGLVVMVVLVRMITPILGHFLNKIDSAISPNLRDMYTLRLATRSALAETDGYNRLKDYIAVHLNSEKFKNSVIGGGVSKEDMPFNALAQIIIRRLTRVDYSGRVPSLSLVGIVHKVIHNLMNNADRHLNSAVRSKKQTETPGSDQENRISVSERVNVKEEHSVGEVVMLEKATYNIHGIIRMAAPHVSDELIEQAISMMDVWKRVPPKPVQFTICQNAMGIECPQIDGQWETDPSLQEIWDTMYPVRGLDLTNMLASLNMMAVASVVLWDRGHYDIVALMTASAAKDRDGYSNASNASPSNMSKDLRDKLHELFPYSQRQGGKRRSEEYRATAMGNVAIDCIEDIRVGLDVYSWNLNLPKEWLNKLPNHTTGRRYALKSDIRNKLAEFAISVATRKN
jgi:hypothetical protein